uniref:glycerol-3-phosphate dehydrogenase n=1 Tax=Cyprinodon variegatus TaxID=28743 RepID=A0A3Q2E6B7_CYPVA
MFQSFSGKVLLCLLTFICPVYAIQIRFKRRKPSQWLYSLTSICCFQARLAHVAAEAELKVPFADELPSRETQLATLRDTPEFDVLVVGGGATGAGCALDAVTRNLKTALVERSDFSSGTSSRSTKLIHGGVRYLQKAIMQLDYEQYMMVKEALHERANLLEIAPHLSAPLPIMLPVYKWWQLPYYWAGIKMYDLVAGIYCLKSSYVLTKSKALEHFPMLKKDKLVGAIVYYDGKYRLRFPHHVCFILTNKGQLCQISHIKVTQQVFCQIYLWTLTRPY